jgi:uncharacterized membrane protein
MVEKSVAFLYKTEAQPINLLDQAICNDLHQEQHQNFRKARVVQVIAGVLFLTAAAFFKFATYPFFALVDTYYSSHSWNMGRVFGDDNSLQERDELGSGQLIGVVGGAFVLVLIVSFILWEFNRWEFNRVVHIVRVN